MSSAPHSHDSGDALEEAITDYPRYLVETTNAFFEPAGAMNALTVGSLAHGPGIDSELNHDASVRAITRQGDPSPFTRVGPGIAGSVKPDVVDFGGTMVFDATTRDLRDGKSLASAGLLTLHHRPTEQVFTSVSGTSCAASLVALKAAQLLRRFPHASANLLRALMVGAAAIPAETHELFAGLGDSAVRSVCGHVHVLLESAAYSNDARVVLYAEDELAFDYFAVYEIPIPQNFQSEKGRRSVRITLAFDPPVRHSRKDYAGLKMRYRLIRGSNPELIFEHYRKRAQSEGPVPELPQRYNCKLEPGSQMREKGTVQTACAEFHRDISEYGEQYYLVVRCESGWSANLPEQKQRFAVVVELAREAEIQLYARLRARLRQQEN